MSDNPPNVAIRLTAAPIAALAVVRLRGPAVDAFLQRHFTANAHDGRLSYGRIETGDDRRVLDDVIVARSGDFADISLHGGAFIARSLLELAAAAGFTVLDSNDPRALASLDGTTLIDRELWIGLSLAATEDAAAALSAEPAKWEQLQREPPDPARLRKVLRDRSLWRLLHPPRVTIVGIPNAGKSTLANALFGRERAITADIPGTTRDWVGGPADIDGIIVELIDTPGLRSSADQIETQAIRRAHRVIGRAHLVLCVLDATQPLAPQDAIRANHPTAVLAMSKTDLPQAWPAPPGAIPVAAPRGLGLHELRRAIRSRLADPSQTDDARWWTRRQRHQLIQMLRAAESG